MAYKKAMLKKVGPRATKRVRRKRMRQMDGMKATAGYKGSSRKY